MQRILIIEDDPEVRNSLVDALHRQGFETIEAENGRAGVQLACVYMPDLILSDIKMEGFDGFAALAAIRYQPLTSAIPVILMTGHPDDEGRRFAMELGADDYLSKPFAAGTLMAVIHVQLKKQAALKQQLLSATETRTKEAQEPSPPLERSTQVEDHSPVLEPSLGPEIVTPQGTAKVAVRRVLAGRESDSATRAEEPQFVAAGDTVESYVETYLRMLNCFHPNLGNTAMRAVALCHALEGVCGLSASDSQDLCCAAALHDISLVGLDREAVGRWLRDPRKVTEEEDAYIKRHPVTSQEMLQNVPTFREVGHIIRSHHENWDGTGYPDRLGEERIPRLARLLAAAVFYCSQHALGMPATKQLQAQSGKMFDPAVVETVATAAEKADIPQGVREILLNEMKTGQIIAKEIYNSAGMVLVHKGRELSDSLIHKIAKINRVTPLDQSVLIYC